MIAGNIDLNCCYKLKHCNSTQRCLLWSNWGRLLAPVAARYDLMKSIQGWSLQWILATTWSACILEELDRVLVLDQVGCVVVSCVSDLKSYDCMIDYSKVSSKIKLLNNIFQKILRIKQIRFCWSNSDR